MQPLCMLQYLIGRHVSVKLDSHPQVPVTQYVLSYDDCNASHELKIIKTLKW
jgi:hypothetical protein